MSMEKRGVCEGENTPPEPQKTAQACDKPACCRQGQECGTDTLSKAAEVAAQAKDQKKT